MIIVAFHYLAELFLSAYGRIAVGAYGSVSIEIRSMAALSLASNFSVVVVCEWFKIVGAVQNTVLERSSVARYSLRMHVSLVYLATKSFIRGHSCPEVSDLNTQQLQQRKNKGNTKQQHQCHA